MLFLAPSSSDPREKYLYYLILLCASQTNLVSSLFGCISLHCSGTLSSLLGNSKSQWQGTWYLEYENIKNVQTCFLPSTRGTCRCWPRRGTRRGWGARPRLRPTPACRAARPGPSCRGQETVSRWCWCWCADSYPQLMVKKSPFVRRDNTDWAMEAVPKQTSTKVPRLFSSQIYI